MARVVESLLSGSTTNGNHAVTVIACTYEPFRQFSCNGELSELSVKVTFIVELDFLARLCVEYDDRTRPAILSILFSLSRQTDQVIANK